MSERDDLDKLTEELHAAARAERPSDARKEAILERVLGKSRGGSGGGRRMIGPLVVLALLIGGVAAWRTRGTSSPVPPERTPVAPISEAPRPEPAPVARSDPQPPPAELPAEAARPPDDPVASPQPSPVEPPKPRRPVDEPDLLAKEVALLDAARAALSNDPQSTLSILEQHRRDFPKGALRVEADLVRIEALLRAGDRRRAEQIASRLIKTDPTGPVAARARRLLEGQP